MNLEQWEVFTYHRSKISSTVLVQYCIVAHKPCLNLLNRIEYIFINWSRLLSIGASLVMYFGVKSKLGTRIPVKWKHLFYK